MGKSKREQQQELPGRKVKFNLKFNPLISIVIPCYNSEKTIEPCLSSLVSQHVDIPYEIIVVDSSTDATPTIVREKFPSVKLIHREQQTYPGAGRNIGVQEAQGEIIAFIDSDCVAAQNWLQSGKAALQEKYSIIGGSVQNGNPGMISWPDYFLTFNEFMPTMPRREVAFMPTCNFMIAKKVFEELGGFREDLLAGEDTLFCYAASRKYQLLFEPAMLIAHTNRETFKDFFRHHRTFGHHSALVRKSTDLPGNILVKYPLLALTAPVVRSGRIGWRMVRYNRRFLLSFLLSGPLLLLGTLVWSYGFIQEALRK